MVLRGGIYNNFKGDDNTYYEAFTILTLPASGSIKDIHNRMPLILDINEENYWLNSESNTSLIKSILKKPRAIEYIIVPLAK